MQINKLKPQLKVQKTSKKFSLIIGTQEDSRAAKTQGPKILLIVNCHLHKHDVYLRINFCFILKVLQNFYF